MRPPAYIDTSAASLAQAADVVFTRIARRVIQISRLRDNSARVGGSDKTTAARLSLVGDLWRSAIKNKLLLIIDKQLTFSYIKDPDCALHCSLAGGRKVMSFYSGYLFSLGGRQQDRLSHTLISPSQLEYAHDFYYPLPQQTHSYLERLSARTADNQGSADKEITLASDQININIVDIPFAPLSTDKQFRDALFDPKKSYSHAIQCAKEAIRDPVVSFDLFSIDVNQDTIALNPQSMAYYVLLLIFPEGVSVEHMTADQAKVMTNIYTSIKGPTNELKFFKKRLQTLESRREFFKWVKHQTIDRFLEFSSSDPRNIQPLYNRKSKLHLIPIATHIAESNPQLLNKLKADFIGSGLNQATELYIQQHFK